jgi:hypothetical protein
MPVSTLGSSAVDSASQTGTGAVLLPSGTTAQRPTVSVASIRFNTTTSSIEYYDVNTATWKAM